MSYHAAPTRSLGGLLHAVRMLGSIPLERTVPFLPRAVLEARRDRRIRAQVRRAWETVPYYRRRMRQAGVRPDQVRGARDLFLVPTASSAALRDDPHAFLSSRFEPDTCHRLSTSGRSGSPKTSFHDPRSLLMNVAYGERHEAVFRSFTRRRTGRRTLIMNVDASVSRHVHREYQQKLRLLKALGPEQRQADLGAPFDEQIRILDGFRPEMLIGLGTFMGGFFRAIRDRGLDVHRPDLIAVGGEGISAEDRRLIEEDFGIPIIMTYQSAESLKIGFECEHRCHYHLHEDLCHVRILDDDGRELPDGETGRVHITNLVNRASVLINFDQGDLGRMLPVEACPCGRTLRRMELVEGRQWPLLRSLDGRALHYVTVFDPLQDLGLTGEGQVVVEQPDHWHLVFRPGPDARPDDWRDRAREIAGGVAGPGIRITLEETDRPALTDSGKWAPVLIRCADQPPYARRGNDPAT